MAVRIELPEDIEHHLEKQWGNLPRHALETLAIEGFRARVLNRSQVRRMQVPGCFRAADQPGTTPFVETSAFEPSRWRGRRFACYTPRVMPQLDVLTHVSHFRPVLNCVAYKAKAHSIPIATHLPQPPAA